VSLGIGLVQGRPSGFSITGVDGRSKG